MLLPAMANFAAVGIQREREAKVAEVLAVQTLRGSAELLLKVKEPIEKEYGFFREGLVLFTYLHLAPDAAQTRGLLNAGCVAIAYETVQTDAGALPLLRPMSEVAGRLSVLAGTHALMKHAGGDGVLLA